MRLSKTFCYAISNYRISVIGEYFAQILFRLLIAIARIKHTLFPSNINSLCHGLVSPMLHRYPMRKLHLTDPDIDTSTGRQCARVGR